MAISRRLLNDSQHDRLRPGDPPGAADRRAWRAHRQGRLPSRWEFRTVNSRFLGPVFPGSRRAPRLRAVPCGNCSWRGCRAGKLECRASILQRAIARYRSWRHSLALNDALLAQIRSIETTVAATFSEAGLLHWARSWRWPGVLVEPELSQDALREAVTVRPRKRWPSCSKRRRREGDALKATLDERIEAMLAIRRGASTLDDPATDRLPAGKLTERLQEAFRPGGIERHAIDEPRMKSASASARKPRSTASVSTSPKSCRACRRTFERKLRHILKKGGQVGKRLDFMMQELNREASTRWSNPGACSQGAGRCRHGNSSC
ncbi:endoribonuclease YicC domain-containing protein [Cupriavidus basilensis]